HDAETVTNMNPLTAEGTIVGTLPYMSPEQIEGKELDARSDIFSLGVMLYEMATGRRPFIGASSAALAASILSSDPPSQPALTPALDRVVRTALEKDPDQRFQTAQDLGRQLRWISEPSSSAQSAVSAAMRPRMPLWAAMVVAAIGLALVGWGLTRWKAPAEARALRVSVALPAGHQMFRSPETVPFAVSPDGRTIAFTAFLGGKRSLFLRNLEAVDVRRIEGTDGALSPFWSTDGAWIGYSTRNRLWKTKPPGGTPQPICDLPSGAQASWRGDTILFTDLEGARLVVHRVSANGGVPVAVTALNTVEREMRHTFPHLLADGKHFLYVTSVEGTAERRLMLGALDSQERRIIASNVSAARAAGDRLLYVRDGKLLAQRFDPSTGLSGDPKVVAEDVGYFFMTGRTDFDVSSSGVLVYATNTGSSRLMLMDRKGVESRAFEGEGAAFQVAPDGKRAAVTVRSRATGLADIWLYDLARGVRDRFTSDPGVEISPVWSPDGRSIVYSQATGGTPRLVIRTIAAAAPAPLSGPGAFQVAGSFSPDGRNLYYVVRDGRTMGIHRLTLDGSSKPEVTVDDPSAWELEPRVSPDGRWLAFTSDASGTSEVYVQDLVSGDRVRISNRGGVLPRWSRNSGELFYVAPDQTIVSATQRGARWNDVVLAELFRARNDIESWDVLPDGQTFLIAESIPSANDALIHVATGW
ncbi:MAG TPA: protein kinase, partial [Thermoanaerobaculia bacterium]|nr:protein kinase [Thermoanaerobaculia bacterium]